MFGRKKKKEEAIQSVTLPPSTKDIFPKEQEFGDEELLKLPEDADFEKLEKENQELKEKIADLDKQIKSIANLKHSNENQNEELTEERVIYALQNHEERIRAIESTLLRLRGAI